MLVPLLCLFAISQCAQGSVFDRRVTKNIRITFLTRYFIFPPILFYFSIKKARQLTFGLTRFLSVEAPPKSKHTIPQAYAFPQRTKQ